MFRRLFVVVFIATVVVITACDRATAVDPTPTPTLKAATAQAGAPPPTRPAPTLTTTPSPTPSPMPTSSPPSPSATPTQTATAVPPTAEPPGVNRVRVVRGVLPNGVICPLRRRTLPDAIYGEQLLGHSAMCELPILSYRLGKGETALVLVGGIHGGYEWNTIALAHALREYLHKNPDFIPPALTVYLVPNANPDGLYAVNEGIWPLDPLPDFAATIPGRFNGRGVDLNRNWDCEWQPDGVWGNVTVSGGSAPFSEPETAALRDYLLEIQPAAVIFLHSAAVGVYPAGCGEIDPESAIMAGVFGEAAGYEVYENFDNYPVSGDAGNWLADQGISGFTVELSTHESLDWEQNLAGLEALLGYLAARE